MKTDQLAQEARRMFILKVAAGAIAGLCFLDYVVFEPAVKRWGEQTERMAALKAKVADGQKLLDREKNLRSRWADMMSENLPADNSKAADLAYHAVGRWLSDSRVTFTSVAPVWKDHDGGYRTHEWQVDATGSQASIGLFLYEMETDHIPVSLEKCEITTRDTRGTQLSLKATFSFLQLPEPDKNKR